MGRRRRRLKEKAPPPLPKKNCIAFKWKTETIYLPDVVITSELRRIADEHLKRGKQDKVEEEKVEDTVPENEWDPGWDDKGDDDDDDGDDLFEVVKKSDVIKSKPRTRKRTSEGESPRKKIEKGPTSLSSQKSTTKRKSIDETPIDNGTEEEKKSSTTDLLKQKFKDRNQLFKNLMEGVSQPSKKCEKCNEEYSDEDSHMKVCLRQLSLGASQSSFRTFDTGSKPAELKCLDCGKTFQKKIHLTLHQKIHASMDKSISRPPSRTFICNFCDKRFERNDDLLSHYQRQHNISNNLHVHQLNTVNRSSSKAPSKIDHTQFIGDEFDCKKCLRIFKTWNQINIHVRMCKAKPVEQQQEPAAKPPTPAFVSDSSDTNDTPTFVSDDSDSNDSPPSPPVPPQPEGEEPPVPVKDPSDSLIISNVRSVGGRCQELPRAPSSISSHNDHNSNEEEESKMPFKCHLCPRRFKFQLQLKLHKRSHCRLCVSCNKRIPESEYNLHSKKCTTRKIVQDENDEIDSTEPAKTCEICGTSFNSNFLLSQHCLVHAFSLDTFSDIESAEFQSNLPFGCLNVKCTNRFSHQSDRDLHLKEKHSSENFGHCGECGRQFRSVFNLRRHRSSAHNFNNSGVGSDYDRSSYPLTTAFVTRPTYYYIQKGFRHNKPPNPHILITDDTRYPAEKVLRKSTSCSTVSAITSSVSEGGLGVSTRKFDPKLYFRRRGNRELRRKDIPIQSIYTCETCYKTFTQSQRQLYIIHLAEHKYPCQLCSRSFRTEGLLQQHMERHTDPLYVPGQRGRRPEIPVQSQYTCETCNRTFSGHERFLYIKHLTRHKYTCPVCGRMFMSDNLLKQHIERHNDPAYVPGQSGRIRGDIPIQSKYTCETCDASFDKSERALYIQHLREHKYTCHKCGRKFQSDNLLKQHLKRHEDPNFVPGKSGRFRTDIPIQDNYTCEKCGKTFTGSERTPYLIHLSEHKYTCQLCNRSFKSETILQQHIKRHDDPSYVPGQSGRIRADIPIQSEYTCETCNKKFTQSERTSYIQHLRDHKYTCHLCDRMFQSDSLLQQHIKRHEDPNYIPGQRGGVWLARPDIPIQEEYICETCNTTFAKSERGQYIQHLREHKYTCHLCDRKFQSENPFKQHLKRHEDPNYVPGQSRRRTDVPIQENYTCEACGETFAGSERATYLIHLAEHKYTCHLCDRKFQSDNLFKQHLKRHEDPNYVPGQHGRFRSDVPVQENYTCETCGETFAGSERATYLIHLAEHKYSCHLCDRKFQSDNLFKQHLKRHEDPNYVPGQHGRFRSDVPVQENYTCETCGETFKGSERTPYLFHLAEHKYTCQLCDRRFKYESQFEQHLKRHDDPNYVPGQRGRIRADIPLQSSYTCETCDKTFKGSERNQFLIHLAQHKREEKFKCQLCGRKHLSEKLLEQHLKRHDDPRYEPGRRLRTDIPIQSEYTCGTCGKTFDDRTLYIGHIYQHRLTDELKCKICNEQFTTKGAYRDHMQQHEDPSYEPDTGTPGRVRNDIPDQGSYTCHTYGCGRIFEVRRLYLLHLASHSKIKRFGCPLCSLKFKSNFALQQHNKRHEDPSYVPRERARLPIQDVYSCEICHKQFLKRTSFQNHTYQHRAQAKHGCHLCERKFISSALLQDHIRKHFDPASRTRRTWKGHKRSVRVDVPYQDVYRCEVCGGKDKTFTDRIKYLLHLRNHFLEENFPCPHCPRRFKSNQILKCHIETHSQIKSYECKECLKRFRTGPCFTMHTRKHCKKVPCKVQCSVCDDRFHTTLALQKHFSRHHADKETDNSNGGPGTTEPEVEHPCPHCRQTFNTTLGLTRHLCLYHPTSEAGLETRNNLMDIPNTNGSLEDGQTVQETEQVDNPGNSEDVDDKDPTWSAGNNLDHEEDDDDYGYDISDMLATDFCETEMAEPDTPESASVTSLPKPPKASRGIPPKRTYSRNVCHCKFTAKLLRKRCHSLQCPCMKADKRCSKKCKCAKDCLNRTDREQEQQQIFKEGRENMIQEELAQRDSSESSPGFEEEELEDELPVPMEITPSAPIIVGQLSSITNNQPSTSTGFSNVMMSSEFISIDTSQDNNFIDEADDVDPLADEDPLQAQPQAVSKNIPSQPVVTTLASLPTTPVSTPVGVRPTENRRTSLSGIPTSTSLTNSNVSNNATSSSSLDNFNQSALLRCQFCKKVFKTMPSFISHFLVHGADFRTLTCPLCNKEYTFLSDYIHHLDQHNKGIFMDCKKCSSRFKSFKDMDRHLLVHHYKPMECGLCSQKFPTSQLMMSHWSKLHPTCQCGLCNVKFFSYDDLTFHMKSLHSPFDCVHCGSRFEKVDPLLDHFLAKHYIHLHKSGTPSAIISKPTPASTSTTNTTMTFRGIGSNPHYSLKCDHCGLLFADHESLNDHLATHLALGRPERQNNLSCDKCGEIFTTPELLHDHLSRHIMGTLPVQPQAQHHLGSIPRITNTFSASNSSMVFMRFTDGNSQYSVQQEPVAPQKDKINDNLDAVEVFTCPKCYKTYNAKHTWMMHLRSYNQPLCSACGSLFETRDELLRHLENKDGRNLPICVVFECRHCLRNFIHSKYLAIHIKKAHTRSDEAPNNDSVPVIIASTSLAPQKGLTASSNPGPNYRWHEYTPPNPHPGGALPRPGASSGEVEEIFLD